MGLDRACAWVWPWRWVCAAPPLPAGRDPVGLYGLAWDNPHIPCLAISGTKNPSGTADHTRDLFPAVCATAVSMTDPCCNDSLSPLSGPASQDLPPRRGCLELIELFFILNNPARMPCFTTMRLPRDNSSRGQPLRLLTDAHSFEHRNIWNTLPWQENSSENSSAISKLASICT